MRAFLDRVLTQLREYFGKASRGDKIRLAIIAAVVVILAVAAVIMLNRTTYGLLLDAQTEAEAGEVVQVLEEMGVPVRTEGTSIFVPEDQANRLRLYLSADNVIGPGDATYPFLYDASGFSVTDSQARKLYEAQRASDIRGSILMSEKIQNCRVIVNFGETSPYFSVQQAGKEATTSVNLLIKGGATLTKNEAQAIAEIVRGSVQGIKYENIKITDTNLNIYYVKEASEIPDDGDDSIFGSETRIRIEIENLLREQFQDQIEQLLTPVFGLNNVKASVSVTLNFDIREVESIVFDPPVPGELDGIIRSMSEMWERTRRDLAAEGVPGTDPNGMGTVEYPYDNFDNNDIYSRMVNEKNYEINETREWLEQERGKVEFLSIGVLVNSDVLTDDYTEEITALVSKALGIPEDHVAVKGIPFSEPDTSLDDVGLTPEELEELERMKQRELIATIIMWAVILFLGLALMLLIRSIVKILHPPPPPPVPEPVPADGPPGMGINYMAGDDDITDLTQYGEDGITDVTDEEDLEFNKKTTGLEQIERFIDKDAASVSQLLRNWLADEDE